MVRVYIFFVLIIIFLKITIFAQLKKEVRAVWLTTNFRLDWPPETLDETIQKKALIDILDNIQKKKFNTIFFQVRSQGSVLYFSKIDPFTPLLTGLMGKKTAYDPLKFFLDEAHKRNIEVHGWINTFLSLTGSVDFNESNPLHILAKKPEWHVKIITKETEEYWLNPGIPEVREHIVNVCKELAQNYDIDGIHLDYIRYPLKIFDDSIEYKLFSNGLSIEDWRRDNITRLVSAIYDSVIAINPIIKVGSAPIGIYENILKSTGLEGKNDVYQDSRNWLKLNKHDYLAPQIYWAINSKPGFEKLVIDWLKNSSNRDIYVGIAAYKKEIGSNLQNYLSLIRKHRASGISFFRYGNIKDIFKGFDYYANIPPMRWKDSIPPNPPDSIFGYNSEENINEIRLWWKEPPKATDNDFAKYYNVYKSENKTISLYDPKNLFLITKDREFIEKINRPKQLEYYFRVTAFDKANNESATSSPIIMIELKNLKNILNPIPPVNLLYIQWFETLKKYLVNFNSEYTQTISIDLTNEKNIIVKNIYTGKVRSGQNIFEVEKDIVKDNMKLKVKTEKTIEEYEFSI